MGYVSSASHRALPPIRLLVVDDNEVFLTHLVRWLSRRSGIEVAGQAGSGREGVVMAERLRPDLVLMDTNMAPMNGFEAVKQIKRARIRSRIVLMSSSRIEEYCEEFVFYADGFLQKDDVFAELMPLLANLFPDRTPSAEE